MSVKPLLSVKDLQIAFRTESTTTIAVQDVSFELFPREILGVVGESGSGKSVSSLALMGLLPPKITAIEGSIQFEGEELLTKEATDIRKLRGGKIAMIFQEPMSSLNPSMRCGAQVEEILAQHTTMSAVERRQEVIALFEKVQLPTPELIYRKYPHQISGGQKQRVMIAMAIACKPAVLIADEPTTALDVTVQKEIISLLKTLQAETEMSILFISHDLALVSEIADRILVMYQGNIVEQGTTQHLFHHPQNPYTQALLAARPSTTKRLKRLPTIADHVANKSITAEISQSERAQKHKELYQNPPLLEVVNLEKEYFNRMGWWSKKQGFKAVNDVSFQLYEGETLGLVGESGCGKSTLGNAILQLDKATKGKVFYKGEDITKLSKQQLRNLRKELQLIFQDPFSSLNPRITVGNAILEPMKVHRLHANDQERKEKVVELLQRVGLSETHYDRYPHEFSGGQRQRIGIARTIALRPKIIVCDESVSALDISVQAQVLNLLNELKEDFGFTYIFISHDLAVVKYMSDQLLVMNQGQIVERGEADTIYQQPKQAYTQKLIASIPKGI